MKQAMKELRRLLSRSNWNSEATRRLRRVISMIQGGLLSPVAQSHREVQNHGPVFVERRTGIVWSCSPSGLLDSVKHGLWDVIGAYTVPNISTGRYFPRKREMPRETRERPSLVE
jgi:hypothetical protein